MGGTRVYPHVENDLVCCVNQKLIGLACSRAFDFGSARSDEKHMRLIFPTKSRAYRAKAHMAFIPPFEEKQEIFTTISEFRNNNIIITFWCGSKPNFRVNWCLFRRRQLVLRTRRSWRRPLLGGSVRSYWGSRRSWPSRERSIAGVVGKTVTTMLFVETRDLQNLPRDMYKFQIWLKFAIWKKKIM